VPPNKELRLTKPCTIGASQLNSRVRRTKAHGNERNPTATTWLYGLGRVVAGAAVAVLLVGPLAADERAAQTQAPIDIRGIWRDTKLDKKGAAQRGLVAAEIQTPRKTKNVPPQYPDDLLRAGVQGVVTLECVIAVNGVPVDCKVVRGPHPKLNEEALRCVQGWRFDPLRVKGSPAPALVEFTVSFKVS
jgi:TonB family protein